MTRAPYYDKRETDLLKGIALILMFVHHFFTFPSWWIEGVSYPIFLRAAPYLSSPLKICVCIFCFLTGYSYFFRPKKNLSYSLRKITDLLIRYWAVFFIFAALACWLVGQTYTPVSFLLEMAALSRPIMVFCWYVTFYVLFMLLMPLLSRILGRRLSVDLLLSVLVFPACIKAVNAFIPSAMLSEALTLLEEWIPCVFIGYLTAAHGLFEKAERILERLRWRPGRIILAVLAVLILPFGRYFLPRLTFYTPTIPLIDKVFTLTVSLDFIYTPLFLFFLLVLVRATARAKVPAKILESIGQESLLMWFLSCLFYNPCREIFQPVLYFCPSAALVTIWGLMLCYAVAFVLDLPLKRLAALKNRLIFRC